MQKVRNDAVGFFGNESFPHSQLRSLISCLVVHLSTRVEHINHDLGVHSPNGYRKELQQGIWLAWHIRWQIRTRALTSSTEANWRNCPDECRISIGFDRALGDANRKAS